MSEAKTAAKAADVKKAAKPAAVTEAKTETAVLAKPEGDAAATAPLEGKEAIYFRLGEMVKEMTGKRIGKSGGRKLFDKVVEEVFVLATTEGTFRFNGGYGSMHVRTYQAGSRRLPNGTETTFGERTKLRYEEGVVVQALVESKGNLAEALKARAAEGGDAAPDAAPGAAPGAATEDAGEVELA